MPKKFNRSSMAVERRKRVIKRLENQLLTGFKSVMNEMREISSVKLTEDDVGRIEKELGILRTRL